MKKKLRLFGFMLASGLVLGLPHAMAGSHKSSVLYIVPVLDDEAYVTQAEAAKHEATKFPEIDFEFTAGSSRNNVPEIIAKIESAVSRKIDVIVIDPGETGEQLVPALRTALAAGVKVVLNAEPAPGLENPTAQIKFDDRAGAVPGGRYMADHLKSGDKIVLLRCFIGNSQMDARANGLIDGLAGSGVEVIATGETHCDPLEARAHMENWITAYPDIKGVLSDTDIALMGAVKAIEAANIDLVVVGHDGQQAALKYIAAGKIIDATVIYPNVAIGTIGVDTAAKLVAGDTFAQPVMVPVQGLITPENVGQFIAK